MSELAIRVENLSKRYRIGVRERRPRTFVEAATNVLAGPFRNFRRLKQLSQFGSNGAAAAGEDDVIWALRDVSFEVGRGEVIGIIGRNGAGKSTLLKILSRITHPTSGRVTLDGRVSSLLEVGTGFHPELTGRENVYLNGTILGMTRREIDGKFDEIVEFSGVEKFIDTPVKRYSSGMRVRLAFSVAAHLEPEILLVDEVLAVGDAEFQKKCLGKMDEVAKGGRTVLFVSHNMLAVESLCERVVWLNNGSVEELGEARGVIGAYILESFKDIEQRERTWEDPALAPGNDLVRLRRVSVSAGTGAGQPIDVTTPIDAVVEFQNFLAHPELDATIYIENEQSITIFESGVPFEKEKLSGQGELCRARCRIPGDLLNAGLYRVNLIIGLNQRHLLLHELDVIRFDVRDVPGLRGHAFHKSPGIIRPALDWKTEILSS